MKTADFTNEHALMIDPIKGTYVLHDKDAGLRKLVSALKRMGKSREEILSMVKRSKELSAMGGGHQSTTDTFGGEDRRKPKQPYYSLGMINEDADPNKCPKCQGKLVSGKDGEKPVKVCMPCRKIYPGEVKKVTEETAKEAKAVYPEVKRYLLNVVKSMEPEFNISIKGYGASHYLGVKIKVKNWDNWNYRELRKRFNLIIKKVNPVLNKKWPFVDLQFVDDKGYDFNWSAVIEESTPNRYKTELLRQYYTAKDSLAAELARPNRNIPAIISMQTNIADLGYQLKNLEMPVKESTPFPTSDIWDIAGTKIPMTDIHHAGTLARNLPDFLKKVSAKAGITYSPIGFGRSRDAEQLSRWFGKAFPNKPWLTESTPFPTKDALKAGFPDVQVGDTIRTRKMSFVGVVTKVVPNDPKRAWTSDAVYFEVEGPPRRTCVTPLSNVTIIKKGGQ